MALMDHMPHTTKAKRRTRTIDVLGGSMDTFTTVFTDRACWRQSAKAIEIFNNQKIGISVTDKIYFEDDPELREQDILVFGTTEYKVRSYADSDASAGKSVLYKVMVENISTER